jgi:hypothetical protein
MNVFFDIIIGVVSFVLAEIVIRPIYDLFKAKRNLKRLEVLRHFIYDTSLSAQTRWTYYNEYKLRGGNGKVDIDVATGALDFREIV